MFNAELKNRFIKEATDGKSDNTIDFTINMLKAIEPYEERKGADLCTFTTEEAQRAFEELSGVSMSSALAVFSFYKRYVSWCIANGVEGACDGVLRTEKNISDSKYEKQMLRNPLQLQSILDKLFFPEQMGCADMIDRCFYWLLYCGIEQNDIGYVTKSSVDFENLVIRLDGVEYPMVTEAIRSLRYACTATELAYPQEEPISPYDKVKFRVVKRVDNEWILSRKSKAGEDNRARSIYLHARKKLIARGKDPSILPSIGNIWMSGVFYREFQRELAGLPSILPEYGKMIAEKSYLNNKSKSYKNTLKYTKGALRRDYKEWKAHFIK